MESGGGDASPPPPPPPPSQYGFSTSLNNVGGAGEVVVGPPQWDKSPTPSPPKDLLEMRMPWSSTGVAVEGVHTYVGEASTWPSLEGSSSSRVFVAVPEQVKYGKSTLLWALENLAKDGAGVVVVHVHCPAQMIPVAGFKILPSTVLNPQRVRDYREKVRAEVEEKLDEYVDMCTRQKVSCEKLIINNENVAKGIEELIHLHGITKLVMGAAADKHHSKKMKSLKSKTALKLIETAASSCKIWFTCKGHLICTREENTTVPAIPPSPAFTVASRSPATSASSHMCSEGEEASRSNRGPRHNLIRQCSEVGLYPSEEAISTPYQLYLSYGRPTTTSRSSIDSWDELGKSSQNSWYGPSRNDTMPSSPTHELENPCVGANTYNMLVDALREAELYKKKADEAEQALRDMVSTLEKAEEMENLHQDEITKRKTAEEALARQAQEIDEMKRQHEVTSNELHDVKEQNSILEQKTTQLVSAIEDYEGEMAANKQLLQMLQTDNQKLQEERDKAVTEAEGLRQKNALQLSMSLPDETQYTEFSSFELEQATRGFNEELKIGDDAFGSVYKGFLRNTTVSIKLLDSKSMQGRSEFNQEIAVLGRVRHPNLITLIGVCWEAFALVYEFLPNGSLENWLPCINTNLPPLTWQVRTKIICEICSSLIFLHSNQPKPVVHGNLKPGNILLDANFVSKLGGFGRATLNGILANVEPELQSLTPRSDVCSFGVIILRLLTARPSQRIAEVVKDAMEREELHTLLDPTAGDWPFVQANQLAHIGLRCAEISEQPPPDLAGEVWKVVEPLMKAASLTSRRLPFAPSLLDEDHPPSYFVCPIFLDVMSDPHIAADGSTYEAEAITGWLDSGRGTSPMTNLRLQHHELIKNRALLSAILEWKEQLRQQQGIHSGSEHAGPSLND